MRCSLLMLLLMASPSSSRAAEPVPSPVDFERHVVGLFSKAGCNAGSCHGSFQGKGGFRLSLFGSEPQKDFQAITRGGGGRRIDKADPEHSLLLLKATGQVDHGGGKRFGADSWQARVFRNWIAAGARHVPGSGAVERLEVLPAEQVLSRPGDTAPIRVQATFADGSSIDVTPFTELRSRDDSIADVNSFGEVKAVRGGDTAIIAAYRGRTAYARALVPLGTRSGPYPELPGVNGIDRAVFAKLRRLNIVPSELSSDEEFHRRVMIDVTGSLPTPESVRAFLANQDPQKREKLIDLLLRDPRHASLWATRMCDITACNVDAMSGTPEERARSAQMWHEWFRQRIAANVPYDRIARGVVTASSRDGHSLRDWLAAEVARSGRKTGDSAEAYAKRETLDLYWKRFEGDDFFPLEKMAELTATAFLGVRLECAQCHRHPFDHWTQSDYRAFANAFGRVRFDSSPELTAAVFDLLEERRKLPEGKAGPPIPRIREVYSADRPRQLPQPETNAVLMPRAIGGPELGGDDPRTALADWMVRPDNPFFARVWVNRVWAHYFGTGLIDPVDDLSPNNPPSNEQLLKWLQEDFISHGFDMRRLERLILTSRTYQLSSTPNDTNRTDRTNFSRAYPRKLMAEVVLDVLADATGVPEEFGREMEAKRVVSADGLSLALDFAVSGRGITKRAIEVASNHVNAPYAERVFRMFNRPVRASTCDCERPVNTSLPQTLFLMTDSVLLKKLTDGRLAALLKAKKSDVRIVEELFLATLSRFPTAEEKAAALDRVSAASDREAGLTDVFWALINTREFILNH